MKTAWDPSVLQELEMRIARLEPGLAPRWGRMTCVQMVVHVTDAFRMYVGDLRGARMRMPVRWFPLKQLLVYVVPMPRSAPTAAELLARPHGEWQDELSALHASVARFAASGGRTEWPDHPVFGRLSRGAYGVLAYKHTDHHLRQFGV